MIRPVVDEKEDGPLDPSAASAGPDKDVGPQSGEDGEAESADESAVDWAVAEQSRPTLPEETADGLDEMDEEIRHQAEDLPLDTSGSLR